MVPEAAVVFAVVGRCSNGARPVRARRRDGRPPDPAAVVAAHILRHPAQRRVLGEHISAALGLRVHVPLRLLPLAAATPTAVARVAPILSATPVVKLTRPTTGATRRPRASMEIARRVHQVPRSPRRHGAAPRRIAVPARVAATPAVPAAPTIPAAPGASALEARSAAEATNAASTVPRNARVSVTRRPSLGRGVCGRGRLWHLAVVQAGWAQPATLVRRRQDMPTPAARRARAGAGRRRLRRGVGGECIRVGGAHRIPGAGVWRSGRHGVGRS